MSPTLITISTSPTDLRSWRTIALLTIFVNLIPRGVKIFPATASFTKTRAVRSSTHIQLSGEVGSNFWGSTAFSISSQRAAKKTAQLTRYRIGPRLRRSTFTTVAALDVIAAPSSPSGRHLRTSPAAASFCGGLQVRQRYRGNRECGPWCAERQKQIPRYARNDNSFEWR